MDEIISGRGVLEFKFPLCFIFCLVKFKILTRSSIAFLFLQRENENYVRRENYHFVCIFRDTIFAKKPNILGEVLYNQTFLLGLKKIWECSIHLPAVTESINFLLARKFIIKNPLTAETI